MKNYTTAFFLGMFLILLFHGCIKEQENVKASFTASSSEVLRADTVVFTNLSDHAYKYEWDFGDGSASSEKNPIHSYLISGKYTVSLLAFGASTRDEVQKDITVLPSTNLKVYVNYGINPLEECTVRLYETKQDLLNNQNTVGEKITGTDGMAFFINLEIRKYYVRALKSTGTGYYESNDNDLPTNQLYYDVDNLHSVFVDFYDITI